MSMTEAVKALLNDYNFTKAFVLDDAYDERPEYTQLSGSAAPDLPDQLDKLDGSLLKELGIVLTEEGLEADDWESGFAQKAFWDKLWSMRTEGRLPAPAVKSAFEVYEAEVEAKKAAIAPLLSFLDGKLGLTVKRAGRESKTLPVDTHVVFLDLFLGITDDAAAREEAADKIKELLDGKTARQSPVVVLMSSVTGEKLEGMAEDLRARAGLMGAKFRVLSKSEFAREDAIGAVLRDLLAPLEKADVLGELIDTWDKALLGVRETILSDLRSLDLSDYAFLTKYRLEVENMALGSYLLEVYSDVMRFRLEESSALLDATAKVDELSFSEMPPAHFLPQAAVNILSHAANFVNDKKIRTEGGRLTNASAALQLGDILAEASQVEKLVANPPTLSNIPVQVVISQACDLQQGKTDEILLLEGTMSKRSWTETIRPVDNRIDCFLWKGMEFTINWQDAKVKTWSKQLTNRRLKPKVGSHLRIARLRSLSALKAQQLFASRLTRIGIVASPHAVKPIALEITFLNEKKERIKLLSAQAEDKLACLVSGALPKDGYQQYVVFSRQFPRRFAAKLLEVVDQMNPSVRADLREFANSEVAWEALRQPCRVGSVVSYKQLKIEIPKLAVDPKSAVGIAFSIQVDDVALS